jgi:hypothetical protein
MLTLWNLLSNTMRELSALPLCLASCLLLAITPECALAQEVVATSAEVPTSTDSQALRAEQIRQMVLSLGRKPSTPAQLVQLARGLQPAAASNLFLQVADDYFREGHCDLAANVLLQLLEKFPDEPVATEATLRLVQVYSSSEIALTLRQTLDPARRLNLPAGWQKNSGSAAGADPGTANQDAGMLRYALYIANGRLQRHPDLAKLSPFAFQCAVSARLSGRTQEIGSWLSLLKHKRESGQWQSRALVEAWLQDSTEREAPLPTTRCLLTDEPPHLDGILNEALWQTADSFSPDSESEDVKSEILITRDAKFCYIAVRCKKIAGAEYAPDNRPRTYDADLAGHDRIAFSLDVDRDYATCFHFSVDHRGQTADACWRITNWNPQWYVAVGDQTETWTIEAAIPWSELAAAPPRVGEVWALSAQRFAPSQQADSPPKSFRLLIFH